MILILTSCGANIINNPQSCDEYYQYYDQKINTYNTTIKMLHDTLEAIDIGHIKFDSKSLKSKRIDNILKMYNSTKADIVAVNQDIVTLNELCYYPLFSKYGKE